MNNAQEMSPDFVLMRLVSAAEDDRLDEENGNVSSGGMMAGLSKDVLTGNIKGGLEFAHPSHLSSLNNAQASSGTTAPDTGVMAIRPSLSPPPPPQSPTEARGFDFSHRGGLRPQLLVFPNILRDGEGILDREPDRLNQPRDNIGVNKTCGSSEGTNNNPLRQQQIHLSQAWALHPRVTLTAVAADIEGGELCHRHRLITNSPDWPLLSEQSNPFTMIGSEWGCTPAEREGSVFDLARRFGELGVGSVPKILFKDGDLPQCSCQGAHGLAAGGVGPGDDPTETSDALLVLEGLGTGDVSGLGMDDCPGDESDDNGGRAFLLNRKREIVQKMSGTFSLSSFQVELTRKVEGVAGNPCPLAHDAQTCGLTDASIQTTLENTHELSTSPVVGPESDRAFSPNPSLTSTPRAFSPNPSLTSTPRAFSPNPSLTSTPRAFSPNPSLTSTPRAFSPNPSLTSTPRRRPERCTSAPRTPTGRGSGGDKTLKVPGKSRKGSIKIHLSKLFRTKSCSGSNHLLDKRPSVAYSIASAGSLVDMTSESAGEQDTDSQPRLARAQSAFSPASFSTFTGETVSLVDVDISRRRANTPHPPTPPPPPRRSLSLLDDIGGPQPGPSLVSVVGASLQSLPLPLPPPPSHATIQHSISLNDAFFRALPHSNSSQMEAALPSRLVPPPMLCPLRRPEASNFTASLRELEKCGWYWGPMNWEDAEMKLKGKHDGSFLVRDSSDPRYILSLSFRSQGVTHHTRMEHYRGTFSLWCHPKFEDRCHSVVEFIERAIMHSKNGKFLYFLRSRVPGLPPTPVQLLHPVSRFSNVKTLQHLCRFCLRQMVRIDHIQDLPLPKPLISYLRKFYYYDPEEETYLSIKSMCSAVRVDQESEPHT